MNRVYVIEKRIKGRRVAMSSETAATVRREGTVIAIDDRYVDIRFDDEPGRRSRVRKEFVNWLVPQEDVQEAEDK